MWIILRGGLRWGVGCVGYDFLSFCCHLGIRYNDKGRWSRFGGPSPLEC